MRFHRKLSSTLLSGCLLLFLLFCSLALGFAQNEREAQPAQASITVGGVGITGLPEDWTHHYLVFSDPGTEQQALDNGDYGQWLKVVNDPRYFLQQLKRRAPVQGPAAADAARFKEIAQPQQMPGSYVSSRPTIIHGDWSMDMGSGAKVGAGAYPAKYSFNGSPQCGNSSSPDFVVYNTSLAGSMTQASIVAYYNLYSSCTAAQVPSVYWAFNTGGTVSTSTVLSITGSQVAFVQRPTSGNAQLVLLKWGATPAGHNVTSGSTNIMNGSKSFTVSASTPLTNQDVGARISGTGIPAGDTIASISSSTAGMLFAAATGNGTTGETLAISADAGSPDTLTAVGTSSYPTCVAPCMTTLTFSGTSRTDAISSPFYDYGSDTLYVGDASGGLHKFHPVFNGTSGTPPVEIGTPFAAVSSTALTSPVYDAVSGKVFVGDASGFVYSVNSSGAVTKSVQVATSPGIVDGPLVDSSAGRVYAFVPSDLNGSTMQSACNGSSQGALACNGVIQFPAAFTAATDYTESVIGVNSTETIYIGAFDNLYWTSGTGNLYVNGINNNTGTPKPKLMRIPVNTSGFITNACQSGTTLPPNCSSEQCALNIDNPMTSATATPSPVTEIYNTATSTDWIFTSVSANSSLTGVAGCATGNGCIYSWNINSALGSGATPSAGLVTTGGTSGIIIDNTSATSGASQVYFSALSNQTCFTSGGTGGCAVQASQSSLN